MPVFTYKELYDAAGSFLGFNSPLAGNNLTKAKLLVARGYQRAVGFTDWSFLTKKGTVTTVSGTHIYPLPDGFVHVVNGRIMYALDTQNQDIRERSYAQIMSMRAGSVPTMYPLYFAVSPSDYAVTTGTRYQLILHSVPTAVYKLNYRYKFDPPSLVYETDKHVGDASFSIAVLQCVFAAIEADSEKNSSKQETLAVQRLVEAKVNDSDKVPDTLGYNGSGVETTPRYRRDLSYYDENGNDLLG